jgi:biopolymer transport protein ExbD
MVRIPNSNRRSGIGFNMTPMIDVVFQLIIFFLVSSHLAKQDAQLKLDLPEATSGRDQVDDQTKRLTLNVLSNGSLKISGRSVSPSELEPLFRQASAEHQGKIEVRIRTDREASYAAVEPILLACAKANVWDVKFAVFEAKEKR